jgi:hypothetical protein
MLMEHLYSGVPFLQWNYAKVGQWERSNTTLVCGCAMAEASCLFRDEQPELYRLVGIIADRLSKPLGEQRQWTKADWNNLQTAIQQWFGLDESEFNFLFVPWVDEDDSNHWFTEEATAKDIAGGIQHLLDGLELPQRSEEECTALIHNDFDQLSNQL